MATIYLYINYKKSTYNIKTSRKHMRDKITAEIYNMFFTVVYYFYIILEIKLTNFKALGSDQSDEIHSELFIYLPSLLKSAVIK